MARGVRDESRRVRARLIVERVLLRATRLGTWNATQVAEVILASLTPSRVTAGVVGPCFYCGDELAATVDHIKPLADGGPDDRYNVVSCCWPCNNLKRDMPLGVFLGQYPFGSDHIRNQAQRDRLYGPRVEINWETDLFSPEYIAQLKALEDVA